MAPPLGYPKTKKTFNFRGLRPTDQLGRGYGAPPLAPLPLALRRFAPPRLAWDLRPLHRPGFPQLQICHYTPLVQGMGVNALKILRGSSAIVLPFPSLPS